jgi:uncharacterized protein
MQGISALCHLPADLSDRAEVARVAARCEETVRARSEGPVLLINNAGYGLYGGFGEQPEAELGMIDLNVRAVVDLTLRLLPLLRERGGWIINVASLAAFQPVPYMTTYAATKGFVLQWSLALDQDLRGSGVRCLALCPGPTESRFFLRAGFAEPPRATPGQTAEAVVEECLEALHRGRAMVVTGWRHRWAARASRLFSKPAMARLSRWAMERWRLDQMRAQGGSRTPEA